VHDLREANMKSTEFTPEEEARIRRRIRERGMTFKAFLPESMADWSRTKLAAGVFDSAREAAFVSFQDLIELDRHPKVRQQLLTAMLEASINDPYPGFQRRKCAHRGMPKSRRWPCLTAAPKSTA
jgi:hypothetical protein